MNSLEQTGINHVYHITPIHYLPRILQNKRLLSKSRLISDGFSTTHFRKTSHKVDGDRGFNTYVHLTPSEWPPILASKLTKGFPHLRLKINAQTLGEHFETCRFNIARTRNIKGGKSPAAENNLNGYYFDNLSVPVAREIRDKIYMLRNCKLNQLEVLIKDQLKLANDTIIEYFSERDFNLIQSIVHSHNVPFHVKKKIPHFEYPKNDNHINEVKNYLEKLSDNPNWKGDGLDFDKLL